MKGQDPDQIQSHPKCVGGLDKLPPALKHGAFSALSILPGEDQDEFIALYKSLAAELVPDGPLETHAVKTIALSQWRASHLTIFQRAKWARAKYVHDQEPASQPDMSKPAKIQHIDLANSANVRYTDLANSAKKHKQSGVTLLGVIDTLTDSALELVTDVARQMNMDINQLLKVPDDDQQLAMLGDVATVEHLNEELAILERLEARIARAMKTLMQTKAIKQIVGTDPKQQVPIHATRQD